MITNNNISTLTLAAGDTFYNNDLEKKFFFNSLIYSKSIFFENAGIKDNFFLISNSSIYKEKRFDNLIYNKKIINYGSLGSLIYFLKNTKYIPDNLLINYLDKNMSAADLNEIISGSFNVNIISATELKKNEKISNSENFHFDDKSYSFNGYLVLNKKTLMKIKNLNKNYFYNNLAYLFNSNLIDKDEFKVQKNKQNVDEIREKIQIAKILLGSKSKSLINLEDIRSASIPKFAVVHSSLNKKEIKTKIDNLHEKIIIRSDSDFEDSFEESNAGKFLSIGPINKKSFKDVEDAINSVLNTYPKKSNKNKVLIQNYVEDIEMSGVITTRLLQNAAPYYCISISESSNSDVVTAGTSNKIRNLYIHKDIHKLQNDYKKYQNILNFIKELEELTNYDLLDIEFAIDKNQKLYLLQVRPLILNQQPKDNKKGLISNIRKFQQLQNKNKNIYGSKTILSNMSDWNPAEMLGESPSPLAVSLYRVFITKDSWHKQRKEFGYRGETSQDLMANFGNKCYIDIRASLNSFLTKSLTSNECERIIDFQTNHLIQSPELHDKIEFEIAETAYVFGIEQKLKKKYKSILSDEAISNWIIDLKNIEKSYSKILNLNNRKIINYYNHLDESLNYFDKKVVKDIKTNMAVPFAHHARLGFVYISHLNHFVDNEVITLNDKQALFNNLNTVSTKFSQDLLSLKNKKLSYKKFISKYGHIRPNNYDLNSKNLGDEGREFIDFLIKNLNKEKNIDTDISSCLLKIDNYLKKVEYNLTSHEWYEMFEKSVTARESSKFMYSKAIDGILNQIKNSDYLEESKLLDINYELLIQNEKDYYQETSDEFELPDVILDSNNFLFFENLNSKPNYIGQSKTKGNIVFVNQNNKKSLNNKIVLLPNADPGWDWVFNLPIKGLITKYGGPNSHMAIRASEKNITSVFGVGETIFQQIMESNILEIDPLSKKIFFNK